MIGKFKYRLTEQDYISFEKFKFRQSRSELMIYITFVLLAVAAVGMSVSEGSYIYLTVPAVFLVEGVLAVYYMKSVYPKKRVRKYIALDSGYLSEVEMTLYSSFIELKSLPKRDGDAAIIGVYPFSEMSCIAESADFFQFITVNEANLLPKKAIPEEIRKAVEDAVRNNPNYVLYK